MNFEISAGKRAQAFQGQVGMENIYRWTQDRVRLWKQLSCALLYKKHGLLPVTTSPAAGDTLVNFGSLLPMGNSGPALDDGEQSRLCGSQSNHQEDLKHASLEGDGRAACQAVHDSLGESYQDVPEVQEGQVLEEEIHGTLKTLVQSGNSDNEEIAKDSRNRVPQAVCCHHTTDTGMSWNAVRDAGSGRLPLGWNGRGVTEPWVLPPVLLYC